jgi:two-component system response regulator ChvI
MTDTNAPSVALIDDDRNIITSLAIALQGEGFVTRLYTDPEAGLKALSENPADVIVCDIKMPRLDGIELLRRLREKSATPVYLPYLQDRRARRGAGPRDGRGRLYCQAIFPSAC